MARSFGLGRRDDRPGDGNRPGAGRRAALAGGGLLRVLALIVDVLLGLVAIVIVAGILFVVLKANKDNSIVKAVHDTAKFLVGPFDDIFEPKDRRVGVAVNWGLALLLYVVVGLLIASLLRRPARRIAE